MLKLLTQHKNLESEARWTHEASLVKTGASLGTDDPAIKVDSHCPAGTISMSDSTAAAASLGS